MVVILLNAERVPQAVTVVVGLPHGLGRDFGSQDSGKSLE